MENDNSFKKGILLKNLALQLYKEGKKIESFHVFDLAKKEIINAGCDEEKPRWLCELAKCFFEIKKKDKFKDTIKEALEILNKIKKEKPWKFTNYLCYTAYELSNLEKKEIMVKKILNEAISSLSEIDEFHLKRKNEIISYLKKFSENKKILKYLNFSSENAIFKNINPKTLTKEDYNSFFSRIFLNKEKIEDIHSMVKKDFDEKKILKKISDINEHWRQAIALSAMSELFLEKSNFDKSLRILNIALKQAKKIRFYWVRDDTLEIISRTFLEIYRKKKQNLFLNRAELTTDFIKDSWKKARSICYIAQTEIKNGSFKQATQKINYAYSCLLNNINYLDRKAMSMLLISEVFDKIREEKKGNKFKMDAFSLLKLFNPNKIKESLEEYTEFVSLKPFNPNKRGTLLNDYREFISLKQNGK